MASRSFRLGVSLALLAALAWWLDAGAIAARLAGLRPGWALAALALSLPQMALLAWRWRVTADRLGFDLPLGEALREYYLGVFLNQVLPGGVTGDVARAWRQAADRATARGLGPALRAVLLERASGQVVMGGVGLLALASTPVAFGVGPGSVALALTGVAGTAVALGLAARSRFARGPLATLWRDARAALLARDVLPFQLLTAFLVVASYLATYLLAARAVGVATPLLTLLPLVPPVLVSMLLPVTVAGWGVREATAAGVWGAVGLSAEDGVAVSACYGLLVLVASLPGALVLLSEGPGRRGDPDRAGSDGSRGGAPPPGSRWGGG